MEGMMGWMRKASILSKATSAIQYQSTVNDRNVSLLSSYGTLFLMDKDFRLAQALLGAENCKTRGRLVQLDVPIITAIRHSYLMNLQELLDRLANEMVQTARVGECLPPEQLNDDGCWSHHEDNTRRTITADHMMQLK